MVFSEKHGPPPPPHKVFWQKSKLRRQPLEILDLPQLLFKELMSNSDHGSRSIPARIVRSAGSSVLHPGGELGRVQQDFVVPAAVDVHDEAHAARGLLVTRVVKAVGLRQPPTVFVERHLSF
jgi:hypothetical protein